MEPFVSICCITYNQIDFIKQAIDSFLMQKTVFPFEIIINDDASTDGTIEILEMYEKAYPDLIFPIYHKENEYSKGVRGIMARNTFPKARGKYIAMCEGDDYWTDSLKLQKQVDFLESNKEYGFVHSECNFLYQKEGRILEKANKIQNLDYNYKDSDHLFDLLIGGSYKIRTATVLFRRDFLKVIYADTAGRGFLMGDIPLWLIMSQLTKFYYLDEVLATYRISENTASRPKSRKDILRFKLSMLEMRIHFLELYKKQIPAKIQEKYNQTLLYYKLYDRDFQEIYSMYSPTKKDVFTYQNANNRIFNLIWRIKKGPNYLKILINKLRQNSVGN